MQIISRMFRSLKSSIKFKPPCVIYEVIDRSIYARTFSTLPKKRGKVPREVSITSVQSSKMRNCPASPPILSDATELVDSLLAHTSSLVDADASNIIAFSGGIDSSLVAALVHNAFYGTQGHDGNVMAVLGVSPSLPKSQLLLARSIASNIGIELKEVSTNEGLDKTYIENMGQACFVCKSHLYSALKAVNTTVSSIATSQKHENNVIMYNGTNADDTKDPTRLGLVAAEAFSVQSPLIYTTKDDVRRAAKHMNLPNWNYAASPCLRSRLALGVEATSEHLQAVSRAEERVRVVLKLDKTINMRVRMFSGKRAAVELDEKWMTLYDEENDVEVENYLRYQGVEDYFRKLGFIGGLRVRMFKSGSVSRELI